MELFIMSNQTMIENIEIRFPKLASPVKTPFGTTQWEAQFVTTDADIASKVEAMGIKVKSADGEFTFNLKKAAMKKDGSANRAPVVVDRNNVACDAGVIGNGTRVNLLIGSYKHSYNGGGTAHALNGIQVLELVEYTGGSGFSALAPVASDVEAGDDSEVAFK